MKIAKIFTDKLLPESTTSRLDLEILLAETLNKPRDFLYAFPEYELSKEQIEKFETLYNRRFHGEPVAYILGKKGFWSLELTVNNKVLIPRPETELLVEIILNKMNPDTFFEKKNFNKRSILDSSPSTDCPKKFDYDLIKSQPVNIADLGTGSGAIALALASERPYWNITATDISEDALQVAKDNACRLGLQNIEFYCGDWCMVLSEKKFDVIVSNPPYIEVKDQCLHQGDVKFEPKIALEAGNGGLNAIKKIIKQAKTKLKPDGLLVLEHGHNQREIVQNLLRQNGYQKIATFKDLAGIDRAIVAET